MKVVVLDGNNWPFSPKSANKVSQIPNIYMATAAAFAKKNIRPIDAPSSGPSAREIMKYAPPASTAPLVEIALIESTVRPIIVNAKTVKF